MSRPAYIAIQENVSGKVKWFNKEKGYGFIAVQGGVDIFLHVNHVNGEYYPEQGDSVTFSIAEDKKRGRTYAVEVTLAI